MYHKIEDCPRCFTLLGRGIILKWKLKRDLKKKGHIIFEETKRSLTAWQLVVSSKVYGVEVAKRWNQKNVVI